MNIGWIGTGVMGNPMCKRLLNNNYKLFIYTRTKSRAENLISEGAIWVNSPYEIVKHVEILFTMVGYPEDVESVYFGENGIFSGIKQYNISNLILIDMTTTKPQLAEKIFKKAKEFNCYSLDAPVSGGDIGARNGTLSIMVGGEKEIFEKVLPILKILGKNIVFQGKAGAGQHTKMANQITIASTMIGVCEALLYGEKAGLEIETMLKSIARGAAQCWTLDNLAPRILKNDFEPGFFVEHFVKDMKIALDEASRMNLSLPGLALVHQLYVALKAQGKGKKGTQALILALKKLNQIN